MLQDLDAKYVFEEAQPAHGRDLAKIGMMASDELIAITWATIADQNETLLDVGARRARREEGVFSYKNAHVALENHQVLAAIISYPLTKEEIVEDMHNMPDVFRPIFSLEQSAINTWNINILATYENARRRGLATDLLLKAEERAIQHGYSKMSLIVRDENPARKLYQKVGYREVASMPMVKAGTRLIGNDWLLMIKDLD